MPSKLTGCRERSPAAGPSLTPLRAKIQRHLALLRHDSCLLSAIRGGRHLQEVAEHMRCCGYRAIRRFAKSRVFSADCPPSLAHCGERLSGISYGLPHEQTSRLRPLLPYAQTRDLALVANVVTYMVVYLINVPKGVERSSASRTGICRRGHSGPPSCWSASSWAEVYGTRAWG